MGKKVSRAVSVIGSRIIIPILVHCSRLGTYKKNGSKVPVGEVVTPDLLKRNELFDKLISYRENVAPAYAYVRTRDALPVACCVGQDVRRGRIYMRGGHRR